MGEDQVFESRIGNFSRTDNVDDLSALGLAIVAETLDILHDLQGEASGAMVIRTREGDYKDWDAEIFGVDEAAEGAYIGRLKESTHPVVLLSEEAGMVDLTGGKEGDKIYGVSDPFDGSWLYKRGLPFMQYSSLALFDANFDHLVSVTGDVFNRDLAFANGNGAFMAKLDGNALTGVERLNESYRRERHGEPAADVGDACVESYLLKPGKFLMPLIDEYRPVIDAFKMLAPQRRPVRLCRGSGRADRRLFCQATALRRRLFRDCDRGRSRPGCLRFRRK